MMFHTNPIELIWFMLSLFALGGTLHILYLSIEERAVARMANQLKWAGSESILEMATFNMWSEMFRFTLALLMAVASMIAVFTLPGDIADIVFFPAIVSNIVIGSASAFVLCAWSAFDLMMRRNIRSMTPA